MRGLEKNSMKKLTPYKRKANYYETDQMGIIHHSNYIRWFEEARLDALEQIGLSYSEMEKNGILIPVLEISCQYQKTVSYNDEIEIQLHLSNFKGVKFDFTYEIFNVKTGELVTTGTSKHCFLKKDFTPFRLKKECPEIFNALMEMLEQP